LTPEDRLKQWAKNENQRTQKKWIRTRSGTVEEFAVVVTLNNRFEK